MGTASLVKITSAHNVSGIVKYNTKEQKTIGHWRNQPTKLQQTDLVSFEGMYKHPSLSLHQQGLMFARQAKDNAVLSNIYKPYGHKISSSRIPKNYSLCHTVVQSFDYKANPNLTPKKVHRMGIQMLAGIKSYLDTNYNYKLNGGLVSTHIDDDKPQIIRGKIHHTHLHNHIIILSYNNQGKSISPYIRKTDLYSFKHINDNVGVINNLKDYYFLKLKRQIQPNSTFTKQRKTRHRSHLQEAVYAFTECNNKSYDKYPNDYRKAKMLRNNSLQYTFQFRTRIRKDSKTGKPHQQFTMRGFINKNNKIMWFNLTNLRLLRWRNKKEERCERIIKQLQINQVRNIPITYNEFEADLRTNIQHIPPIEQLSNNQSRKQFQRQVQIPKQQQQVEPYHEQASTLADFFNKLSTTKRWSQIKQTGNDNYQINHVYNILNKNNNIYQSPYNVKNNDNSNLQRRQSKIREQHRNKGIQR